MVWHQCISYQFNCTCVLCVTQRESKVPDSAAVLQCCSLHWPQSSVSGQVPEIPRTENTPEDPGWAAVCCVQMVTALHHSAPAQIEFLSDWSCNKWIETTGTHKSALWLDISSHWDRDPKTEWNWFYFPWSCNIPNTELNSLCYQIYCGRRPEAGGEEIIIAGDIKLATQGVRPGLIVLDTVAVGAPHNCFWYLHQAQATHLKWHKYDLFKIHYSNIETRFLACSWGHGSSSVVARNLKVKSG